MTRNAYQSTPRGGNPPYFNSGFAQAPLIESGQDRSRSTPWQEKAEEANVPFRHERRHVGLIRALIAAGIPAQNVQQLVTEAEEEPEAPISQAMSAKSEHEGIAELYRLLYDVLQENENMKQMLNVGDRPESAAPAHDRRLQWRIIPTNSIGVYPSDGIPDEFPIRRCFGRSIFTPNPAAALKHLRPELSRFFEPRPGRNVKLTVKPDACHASASVLYVSSGAMAEESSWFREPVTELNVSIMASRARCNSSRRYTACANQAKGQYIELDVAIPPLYLLACLQYAHSDEFTSPPSFDRIFFDLNTAQAAHVLGMRDLELSALSRFRNDARLLPQEELKSLAHSFASGLGSGMLSTSVNEALSGAIAFRSGELLADPACVEILEGSDGRPLLLLARELAQRLESDAHNTLAPLLFPGDV